MKEMIEELQAMIVVLEDEQRLEFLNHRAGMIEGLSIAITVLIKNQ